MNLRTHLVAVLVGATVGMAGCAARPVGRSPAHREAPEAAAARKTVRVRAQVRGEGTEVVVTGTVRGFGSPGDAGHADIAAYDERGRLILSASVPYVPTTTDEASFEKRLPGLRGRRIRLRLAHHGTALPAGSGSCPNNAALMGTSGASPAAQRLEESRSGEYQTIEIGKNRGLTQ